jgi:predicted secreted hydrolase
MKKWKQSAVCLAAACAVLAAFFAGCKEQPKQIVFPYDHGPHFDAITEWWHFGGELKTSGGSSFGYEIKIFKVQQNGEAVFVTHLAISDPETKEHYFTEYSVTDNPGLGNKAGNPAVNAEFLSFTFDEDTGFHIGEPSGFFFSLDLQREPVLPVVLEGDNGTINMPDGHIANSYSFTNLKTTGSMVMPDGVYRIFVSDNTTQSRSWMNHQWGNFSISNDALQAGDRFWLRFEDGSSLMALQFRNKNTNKVLNNVMSKGLRITPHWVYQRADGTVVRGKKLSISHARTWQDTQTNATYPMDWTINIPDLSATITAAPAFDDQSLYGYNFIIPPYWAGIGSAQGTIEGTAKNATAYSELWGYDAQ